MSSRDEAAGATAPTTRPARATRREWIGLAVIAPPCMVYAMDLTVLTLAVPALSADLRPSSTELLWIVDIYGFPVAGFLMTMGTLGDRVGRRLLLIGAGAFSGASVLAALSTSPEMLIVSRALLGSAGATVAPSTLSLIRNMFLDDRQRTVAIGIWVTSFSTGAAIGPLVGGALIEGFSWSSVFLMAVPVMALLLALGPRLLPEYEDPNAGRLDLTSAALSLLAVLAMIYGIKALAADGAGVGTVAPVLAGVALGAVFVTRQRRLAEPMIDLGLFRRRAFSLALSANTLGFAAVFGIGVFVAQYLRLVLGSSPLAGGALEPAGGIGVHRRGSAHRAARGASEPAGGDARRDRRRAPRPASPRQARSWEAPSASPCWARLAPPSTATKRPTRCPRRSPPGAQRGRATPSPGPPRSRSTCPRCSPPTCWRRRATPSRRRSRSRPRSAEPWWSWPP